MKISEFRALIKEEVRKVLKESKTTRRTLKEGVIEDLQVEPKTIGVQWEEAENLMDYVKAKHKLGPRKYVAGEGGDVEIYKIGTTPYILVDEDGFGAIFKASDSSKVISAIKDGSYFDWNESVVNESMKRKLRETYMDDQNLYLDDFNQLDPATLKKLDTLVKLSDEQTVETDEIYDLTANYMSRDSFEDLYGWIDYYTAISTKLKSKAPKLAKTAAAILSIIKPLDK